MSNREKKLMNAEEMLESIFYYMNQLFEVKEFSTTVNLLTDLGSTIVGADRASFWFWDKRKEQYWTLAAKGNSRITIPENTGIVGECISHNEILLSNSPYSHPGFNNSVDKKTGYLTKSILCMPVTDTENEVIGAFQVLNKYGENGEDGLFDESDIKRLSLVAAFCEKTLESYLLHDEAQRDQLTGLKNRYALYEYYNRKILPVMSEKEVSIIMCDIDHFKNVNDTYGHNVGDDVLKHVADIFTDSISVDDEIVRWGGEEFIFVIRNAGLKEAKEFAEVVRQKIESTAIEPDGINLKITMSFGVHQLDEKCTLEQNIKSADDRLYKAKNTGRNRVV